MQPGLKLDSSTTQKLNNQIFDEETHLHKLLNREPKTFQLFYQRYSGAIYGHLIRTVKNEEKANELLHKTFINIWHQLHEFKHAGCRLFTWIQRISNACCKEVN